MHCANCKINTIDSETPPFGGYLCTNGHLQCQECEELQYGLCGVCDTVTSFVLIRTQSKKSEASGKNDSPSTSINQSECIPCPESEGAVPCFAFTQSFLTELEKLSHVSQEHLSLPDSVSPMTSSRSEVERQFNCHSNETDGMPKDMQEDNDGEIIDTSQIQMQLNDMEQNAENPDDFDQQQATFSEWKLYDFESHNTANSIDMVENYLRTYEVCGLSVRSPSRCSGNSIVKEDWTQGLECSLSQLEQQRALSEMSRQFNSHSEEGEQFVGQIYTRNSGSDFMELQEDNDGEIIDTSQIQMQLNDMEENADNPDDFDQELATLSEWTLYDFDTHNTANPNDMVEDYLRSLPPVFDLPARCNSRCSCNANEDWMRDLVRSSVILKKDAKEECER